MPLFIFAVLICQLPFEVRVPIFHFAGFTLTNLELTAYAALAIGGWTAIRRNASFDPLDWALLAWCVAWLMAGLSAPINNYESAVRHAARMMTGPILCLFARAALAARDRDRLGRLFGLVGAVAAAFGIFEILWPAGLEPVLSVLRAKPTTSPWGLRASGTFEHANQLAAFLETALPFTLLAIAVRSRTERQQGLGQFFLVMASIIFAMSRSGWGAAALALLVTGMAARNHVGSLTRRHIAWGLAGLTVLSFTCSPRLWSRLLWPMMSQPFAAALSFSNQPSPRILVTNTGRLRWPNSGAGKVMLSVRGKRLFPDPKEAEVFVNLPHPVAPGGRAEILINPAGTLPNGRYLHVYDLYHATYGYSSQWNVTPVSGETIIHNGQGELRYTTGPSAATRRQPASRPDLWGAAWQAFKSRPWLGIGPGQFQLTYGRWLPHVAPDPRLHPNNLYLHILAEGGVPAVMAFLALVWTAAARLWASLRRARPPLLACAGAGVLTAWLAHGFFDSFLLFNGCATAFWLALALCCPHTEPSNDSQH